MLNPVSLGYLIWPYYPARIMLSNKKGVKMLRLTCDKIA
jgi:hypothetical protein